MGQYADQNTLDYTVFTSASDPDYCGIDLVGALRGVGNPAIDLFSGVSADVARN